MEAYRGSVTIRDTDGELHVRKLKVYNRASSAKANVTNFRKNNPRTDIVSCHVEVATEWKAIE